MSDFKEQIAMVKESFLAIEQELGDEAILADTMYLLACQLIILKELGRMTHILENIESDMSYSASGVTKP